MVSVVIHLFVACLVFSFHCAGFLACSHFRGRGLDAFHTINIIGYQWLLFWLCSHVLWFCHLCCCGYKFGSLVLTFVEVSIVQRSEPVALADKPEQSRNEVVNVA